MQFKLSQSDRSAQSVDQPASVRVCACVTGVKSAGRKAGTNDGRDRRISHAIRPSLLLLWICTCMQYAVRAAAQYGVGMVKVKVMVMQWHALIAMDAHLRNNPPRGQDRGQDRPGEGGRRLIWLIQLADLAQARRSPVELASCTVRRTDVYLPFVDFFFLNSHVTRWDRIRPILICSPRIPAPRGGAARPTALKTARVNRAWCSLVPLVPKNRVVKGDPRAVH